MSEIYFHTEIGSMCVAGSEMHGLKKLPGNKILQLQIFLRSF